MLSTDSAALEYAFNRYRGDVYAFVLRRIRDPLDAEELTQQTFVDAAAAFSRGARPRALRGWLFAVAERRIADELRRRGKQLSPTRPSDYEDAAVEPLLGDALGRLAPDDARLLFLRFVEERSHLEIAAALGCNEAASRMRVSRALGRLRRELGIEV